MPELPEVENVVRELRQCLLGETIQRLEERRAGMVHWFVEQAAEPLGRITAIDRRGKYLLFALDSGLQLVGHLRMTGKFVLPPPGTLPTKHTRVILELADNREVFFEDARTFGHIDVYPQAMAVPALEKLGPEPFDPALTGQSFQQSLAKRHGPIKPVLLDQTLIAGVGNIYASEALYRAGIRPQAKASSLSVKRLENLLTHLRDVLNESIALGGSSINSFRRIDDKTGQFQDFLRVYERTTAPCGHEVRKIKQAGRSTYYCPECQK